MSVGVGGWDGWVMDNVSWWSIWSRGDKLLRAETAGFAFVSGQSRCERNEEGKRSLNGYRLSLAIVAISCKKQEANATGSTAGKLSSSKAELECDVRGYPSPKPRKNLKPQGRQPVSPKISFHVSRE